jgi:hypothetical protein
MVYERGFHSLLCLNEGSRMFFKLNYCQWKVPVINSHEKGKEQTLKTTIKLDSFDPTTTQDGC